MRIGKKDLLRKLGDFLLSISAIVILLIIWQIVVEAGIISERKLAPPTKVVTTFIDKLTNCLLYTSDAADD